MSTATVKFLIGPEQRLFEINKEKLISRIPVLEFHFNGEDPSKHDPNHPNYSHSIATQTLICPEISIKAFEVILLYIDVGNASLLEYTDKDDDGRKIEREIDCWNWPPFEVYKLAYEFMCPQLQDAVMDELVEGMRNHSQREGVKNFPSLETIKTVYNEAPKKSQMRRLMAEMLSYIIYDLYDHEEKEGGWSTEKILEVKTEQEMVFKDFPGLTEEPEQTGWGCRVNEELFDEVITRSRGRRGLLGNPLMWGVNKSKLNPWPCTWHGHYKTGEMDGMNAPNYRCPRFLEWEKRDFEARNVGFGEYDSLGSLDIMDCRFSM